MATLYAGFRLPKQIKEQFFDICEANGIFATSVVTRLLDQYITEQLTDESLPKRIQYIREMKARQEAYEKEENARINASGWSL